MWFHKLVDIIILSLSTAATLANKVYLQQSESSGVTALLMHGLYKIDPLQLTSGLFS